MNIDHVENHIWIFLSVEDQGDEPVAAHPHLQLPLTHLQSTIFRKTPFQGISLLFLTLHFLGI